MTVRAVLAALLLGLCSVGCTAPSSGASTATTQTASPAPRTGIVRKVVDGDTVDVQLGRRVERVRLIGIDTPESVKPDAPVECYGVEASHHLAELLPVGTEVELVRDTELRDRYGRLLAYVFRPSDGLFVNLAMAADGYANTLTFPPNVTFADDFVAAVATARQAGSGLWSACADPTSLFDAGQ
ncbi:MAG: thermonuclease family protein [Acidimicrobiales bacterium]|nr:thermonuclease family protein [Acidimicrobiales bacterium]